MSGVLESGTIEVGQGWFALTFFEPPALVGPSTIKSPRRRRLTCPGIALCATAFQLVRYVRKSAGLRGVRVPQMI
jgi:hypothetical protein